LCYEVLATAVSSAMSVSQANAQSKAYSQQAQIARNNALRAQDQAANVAKSGAYQEAAIRQKGKQIIGTQTADYSAANIDTNSGSAQQVAQSTDYSNLMDALNVRHEAANQSWAYETQAQDFNNQASSYDAAAKNAKTAGYINAGTTLLTGATSLNSDYSKYTTAGGKSSFWNYMWGAK